MLSRPAAHRAPLANRSARSAELRWPRASDVLCLRVCIIKISPHQSPPAVGNSCVTESLAPIEKTGDKLRPRLNLWI